MWGYYKCKMNQLEDVLSGLRDESLEDPLMLAFHELWLSTLE